MTIIDISYFGFITPTSFLLVKIIGLLLLSVNAYTLLTLVFLRFKLFSDIVDKKQAQIISLIIVGTLLVDFIGHINTFTSVLLVVLVLSGYVFYRRSSLELSSQTSEVLLDDRLQVKENYN